LWWQCCSNVLLNLHCCRAIVSCHFFLHSSQLLKKFLNTPLGLLWSKSSSLHYSMEVPLYPIQDSVNPQQLHMIRKNHPYCLVLAFPFVTQLLSCSCRHSPISYTFPSSSYLKTVKLFLALDYTQMTSPVRKTGLKTVAFHQDRWRKITGRHKNHCCSSNTFSRHLQLHFLVALNLVLNGMPLTFIGQQKIFSAVGLSFLPSPWMQQLLDNQSLPHKAMITDAVAVAVHSFVKGNISSFI
jgi:hypothetical protein